MAKSIYIAIILLLPVSLSAETSSSVRDTIASNPVTGIHDAAQRAVAYFGWRPSPTMRTRLDLDNVSTVVFVDSSAPEMFSSLGGRRAYRVPLLLCFDTLSDSSDRREFEVFIDSTTGKLLKISSTLPSFFERIAADSVDLSGGRRGSKKKPDLGGVRYLGLPTEKPRFTFLQAFSMVPWMSLHADRIFGRHVHLTTRQTGEESVWLFEVWGGFDLVSSGFFPYRRTSGSTPRRRATMGHRVAKVGNLGLVW